MIELLICSVSFLIGFIIGRLVRTANDSSISVEYVSRIKITPNWMEFYMGDNYYKFYGSGTVWHSPSGGRCSTSLEYKLAEIYAKGKRVDYNGD